MDNPATDARPVPAFETTTRLFARALTWSPERLLRDFRPAGEADLPALLAFRRQCQRDWDDVAYLRWRYGLGKATHPHGRLWIVPGDDGAVLAAIGQEHQPIRHGHVRSDGQLLVDLQLEPALEGAGGGVWLNQALFRQAQTTLAVGGNAHSLGLVRRLFAPLGVRQYHALPLRTETALRRRGVPALASAWLATSLDAGLRVRSRRALQGKREDFLVHELSQFEPVWLEALYGALSPSTALVAPDADHLNWRLFDNPRAKYRVLGATHADQPVGYVAVRQVALDADGDTGMHVLDWKLAADHAMPALIGLMAHVVALARDAGCSKVFTTSLSPDAALLQRCGFLTGRSAGHLIVGVHPAPPEQAPGATAHWQITDLSFDGDGQY